MELGQARNKPSVEETSQSEQHNASIHRLHILSSHFTPVAQAGESYLVSEPCSRAVVRRPVSTVVLAHYMAGEHRAEKEKVLQFFQQHPDLLTPVEIPKEQHRELVLRQLLALVREAGVHPLQALTQDPSKYFTIAEAVGLIDLSLAIKMGVQNSLWGGSVINLGTQKHHDKFFAGIDNLDYPGCFAMTELHHGSNVQGIQTTATFDPATDEFIVNTPNEGATKWWIGNAACHGKFATVFARLRLPVHSSSDLSSKAPRSFEDFGVHAIIVPLRSLETGAVLPGVEIRDCGYKVGLNGVDNGAIRFYNVRVPRENLLDRFGSVAADGQYSSDLPSASKRFAATLGELVGGRVGLAYGSVGVLKIVTTIAVRYSLLRQQFGPSNKPEVAILDYQSQQQRLMPMLASAYAFHFAAAHLVKQYSSMKAASRAQSQGTEELVADVHVLSAGLKAYVTSYTQAAISTCRESCGGHGYAAVNRFGQLRNDHDIFLTFEGDNTVLLQQVAADLLKRYKEKFAGGALSVAWTYLKDSMGTYLAQTNPVTTHREGQAHLRDPQFQLDAFQYRTAKLLHTAALRLRKHTPRLGPFGAWNRCLNHLLTLAESHIESVILAHFIAAVDRCEDKESKQALKLLCDLYALDRIWSDIGTYRNEDYVAPNKAKAIHRLVEYLCYEARGMARELVDAFGIPDALLRAPIGLQSGQYAEYSAYIGF